MSFPPGHGRLKFGEPLLFNDDGTISSIDVATGETVTIGSADSPLQIRRPQPIGKFDEEPVKIPPGHPLAGIALKPTKEKKETNEVDKARVIAKQRKYLRLLTEHLRKSTAATKEAIQNGEQTLLARKELNQDRVQKAGEDVAEVEHRIGSEIKNTKKFVKLCHKTLEKCTHTSQTVCTLSDKVDNVEQFEEKHVKAAHTIRVNLNALLEIVDTVKYLDRVLAEMAETLGMNEMEEIQESFELSLSLLAVQDSLKTIKSLAPNMFRTASNPLGQHMEETVTRINLVESALTQHFPAALREAVTTASTVSTLSLSSATYSQETSVDVATASTQPSRHIRINSWPSASFQSAAFVTEASTYHGVHSPLNRSESDELLAAGSQESLVSTSE